LRRLWCLANRVTSGFATAGRANPAGRSPGLSTKKVIDASGLIVSPAARLRRSTHPLRRSYSLGSPIAKQPSPGWHGVTSLVLGNCGFGFAPCTDFRDRSMLTMTRTEAFVLRLRLGRGMKLDCETILQYMDSLESRPKGHQLAYSTMPTAVAVTYFMGLDAAKTPRDVCGTVRNMARLLDEGHLMRVFGGFSIQRLGVNSRGRLRRFADGHRHDVRTRIS